MFWTQTEIRLTIIRDNLLLADKKANLFIFSLDKAALRCTLKILQKGSYDLFLLV